VPPDIAAVGGRRYHVADLAAGAGWAHPHRSIPTGGDGTVPEGRKGRKQQPVEGHGPPHGSWRLTPRIWVGVVCLAWLVAVWAAASRLFPGQVEPWVQREFVCYILVTHFAALAMWIWAIVHWPTPREQKEEQRRLAGVAEGARQAEERRLVHDAHGGRCQVCGRLVKASGRSWAECRWCKALVCRRCQKKVVTSANTHLALCPLCADLIAVTELPVLVSDAFRMPEKCREAEKRVVCCASCGAWGELGQPPDQLADIPWAAAEEVLGNIPEPARRIAKLWLCKRCMDQSLTALLWAAVKDQDPPDARLLARWLRGQGVLGGVAEVVRLETPCECGAPRFCAHHIVVAPEVGVGPGYRDLWRKDSFAHVCVHCGRTATGKRPKVKTMNWAFRSWRGCPLPGHPGDDRERPAHNGG
jgi:hypothetical protein